MRVNNKIQKGLTVYKQVIEQVKAFPYFGGSDEDDNNRIRKANGTFIQLYPIWRNKYISEKTKVAS